MTRNEATCDYNNQDEQFKVYNFHLYKPKKYEEKYEEVYELAYHGGIMRHFALLFLLIQHGLIVNMIVMQDTRVRVQDDF